MNADSFLIHLSTDEVGKECDYQIWKQRFPVKHENKVDVRKEVEERVITLAFPIENRLKRGVRFPGIYAFLPTETVTNFPFIIQADFLLGSSRESVLWDNKWNKGILDCVPDAFLNAFTSLVKSTEIAHSNLPNMFRFLPTEFSLNDQLFDVSYEIQRKPKKETIVPCESYTGQKMFRKPREVGRLKPEFWTILDMARSQNVSLHNISSHGKYPLNSSFDQEEYNAILNFLKIKYVDDEWYARCIPGTNLVMGVSEDVYLKLLVFISENWGILFHNTSIKNIPIMKYVGKDGKVNLYKTSECKNKLLAAGSDHLSWMINWNTEIHWSTGQFFLPKPTQEAIVSSSEERNIKKWLRDELEVVFVTIYEYAEHLGESVNNDHKLAVTYAHFLYHSQQKSYLQKHEVQNLCDKMPIVDNYGRVTVERIGFFYLLMEADG